MTRGSVCKNFGPCVVCSEENISEGYKKITIIKTHKCPTVQSLNVKLQVGDQLCKKHYNELINYNRNDRPNHKQNIDKDTSFYAKVNQHKRICLSEKDYQNLCNKLPTETTGYQMEIYFIILLIYLLVSNFLINLIG